LQRNSNLKDDDIEEIPSNFWLKGIQNKPVYNHKVSDSIHSLSAAAISNVRNPLDRPRLEQCADAYFNNGVVRTIVDKSVWFVLGPHVKFVIEPNDELVEGMDDAKTRKIEDRIANNSGYKQLRKDILRINKRVQLHDRLTKFMKNINVYGRTFDEIKRFPTTSDWPIFGEPQALKPLHPMRVKDTVINQDTYEFEGIVYNYGTRGREAVKVPSEKLLAGWYDDDNIFDNTYGAGASPVWTVLSASQTIETILDKNLPEFVTGIAEGFGFIYSGSNKKSVSEQIKKELAHSTFFIHNYKDLDVKQIDIARDPNELRSVVEGLGKYMCQALNLPLFLLFEDTANFATANQVMQVYKVSTLNRLRTWLSDILEKYWYDPILADYFNIPIEEVISQEVRIKPVFEDINFETRLDIVTADEKLVNMGVYDPIDVAEDIEDDKVVRKLELQQSAIDEQRQASIDQVQAIRAKGLSPQEIANQEDRQNGVNQNQNQQNG